MSDSFDLVIIGGGYIGLEVAAAWRARELEMHVVAPEKRPSVISPTLPPMPWP